MSYHAILVTVAFMIGMVAPVTWITWYSVRSDHHSPHVLQEIEEEIEEGLEELEEGMEEELG